MVYLYASAGSFAGVHSQPLAGAEYESYFHTRDDTRDDTRNYAHNHTIANGNGGSCSHGG
jgi:hypothetical protein